MAVLYSATQAACQEERRSPMKKIGTVFFITALFFAFNYGGASSAELNLGYTAAVVGGHLGDYGQGNKQGIELAVKAYNEKGGYKGQKVNLVIYDTEGKPPKAVENATRLITRDKV